MSTIAAEMPVSKPARMLGRVLSGLVIVFMLFDGAVKLVPWPVVTESMEKIGYGSSETLARSLGVISLVCTILYAIPPTSFVGAILLTGYLGGAMASHLRIGSPLFTHVLFGFYLGLMVWGGFWLRDGSLRTLLPLPPLICLADHFIDTEPAMPEDHCHHRRRACGRDRDRPDPRRDQAGYVQRPARDDDQGAAG